MKNLFKKVSAILMAAIMVLGYVLQLYLQQFLVKAIQQMQ